MILVAIGGTGWPVKLYQGFQAFFFCICFHFISKYVSFECLGGFFCYDHEGRLGGQSNSTEVFKHFFAFFISEFVPFEYLGGFFCCNREGRPGGQSKFQRCLLWRQEQVERQMRMRTRGPSHSCLILRIGAYH